MANRNEIVDYLNQKLRVAFVGDVGINGLQVEGSEEVRSIAVAVDAGESVIQKAVQMKADLLAVHHGIFWEKAFPITGAAKRKVGMMMESALNLYASHLPLDADPDWGNNFTLGRFLSLGNLRSGIPFHGTDIGCFGENKEKLTLEEMRQRLQTLPGGAQTSTALNFGPAVPNKVCIVTGSGCDALYRAEQDGFDTLVTGEPRQFAYHFCKEQHLNVIFAGHYATETVGVQELGKAIEAKFSVPWTFIDEPTGI